MADEDEEPQGSQFLFIDLVSPTFDSSKLAAQSTALPLGAQQMNSDLKDILSISKTKVAEEEEDNLINSYDQNQLDKFLAILNEKQDSAKKEIPITEETKEE